MTGLGTALLLVLGASAPPHPVDLQVEAVTAAGVELSELAEAVARAMVAGGARVVLRVPGSGPCEKCARVEVTETGTGTYRVDVKHRDHVASTTLRLPAESQLFDRAHAVAIQARMLMPWSPAPEGKSAPARPSRRTEVGAVAEARQPPAARPRPATTLPTPPAPSPGPETALAKTSPIEPLVVEWPPAPPPTDASHRETEATALASEGGHVDQPAARPVDRARARPAGRNQASAGPANARATTKTPIDLATARGAAPQRRWPWIPAAAGAGAAVAAVVCAVVARDRYNGLEDRSQSYASAHALKSQGESWQLASYVLAGVAAVGIGTGIVGFSTGSSGSQPVAAVVSPVPGGGMVAIAGRLP